MFESLFYGDPFILIFHHHFLYYILCCTRNHTSMFCLKRYFTQFIPSQDCLIIFTWKTSPSTKQREEYNSQAKHVDGGSVFFSFEKFWSNISWGTTISEIVDFVYMACKSKVTQFNFIIIKIATQQNILQLQIPMNYLLLIQILQC